MIQDISELKHVRKALGITQSELAKLSGVSQSLIAKIESGSIDPTYSRARRLIETLQEMGGKKTLLAKDVMNRKIISASPRETISEVIALMKKHNISQLPVVHENNAVGILSESILLDALTANRSGMLASEAMGDAPPVVSLNSGVAMVADLLKHYSIVLVNDRGKLVGVVTKADILQKAFERR